MWEEIKARNILLQHLLFRHSNNHFIPLFYFLVLQDFVDLLREQAPLESYVEWLDRLVETKIIRVSS